VGGFSKLCLKVCVDFSHDFRRVSSNGAVFSEYIVSVWGGLVFWGETALSLEPAVVLLGICIVGGVDFVFEFV
jgi:hypothetical protein